MVLFRRSFGATAIAAWLLACAPAAAQTFSVERIDNPAVDLGQLVASASGDTVFRIDAATGDVTRVTGTGSRMSASTARAIISIKCSRGGKTLLCNTEMPIVQIGSMGAGSGRARALTNLNVAPGTASVSLPRKTADPLSFTIAPLGEGGIATLYLGADFTIQGDSSGLPSGPASAPFYVTVSKADGSGASTASGLIQATVMRPITLALDSHLDFGAITRPSQGSGMVILEPGGARTLSGAGVVGFPIPTPKSASFTVSGEGGQSFSVYVPPVFEMKASGGSITVTTSTDALTSLILKGREGTSASTTFNVGGSFPITSSTRTGAYKGSFLVMVQYN